ncbi:MAG: cysteine desulfurase family protein [Planctomycetota bacterium]|nr:cysteine desulfurase family protein [Planctomycetota bacterium]MDA1212490.1 cysteine desulfurase family protein [Planctomycetota bacterium]
MAHRPIYLDHHSTTPVDPGVWEAMSPYFTEAFGNAASINHAYGWEAAKGVDNARRQIAELIGTEAERLIFTSGATESNNLVLKGVMRTARPGSHLVINLGEHRSIIDPAKRLQRGGNAVTQLPIDEHGMVNPQHVAEALRPNTVLVSVIWANNEVGTINAVAEIGEICRQKRVLFHTDATQAVGKIPIDLSQLPIDLMSFSAHKLYGPKGIGALWIRGGSPRIIIEPLIDGGGHERHLRSGTLPVPLIVGFGTASEIAKECLDEEAERLADLRDHLWSRLQRLEGVNLHGHPTHRLPGNLNISIAGVDGEALMTGLKAIAVSSGSACTTADPEPSHVLRAMGVNDALSRASLRFGIGRFNTRDEIEQAADVVIETVSRLRRLGVISDSDPEQPPNIPEDVS